MTAGLFARARVACLGAALALLAIGAGAQSASAQGKSLRIAYTAIPTNITINIADEQGFFKKYGLDVKLTPNPATGTQLPSIGKQYDIIVGTVADLWQYAGKNGDPVVVAMGTRDDKTTAAPNLMVEKGTTSLKQLKGKTVCVITVGAGQQYVSAAIAFKKAGLDPKKDVKFLQVPFANQLDSLRAGRCDAALNVQPFLNQIKNAGYAPLNNTLLSVAKIVPGALWITRRSVLKKDEKKFIAFRRAFRDAVNFCKKNNEVCVQSIVKNLGTNVNAARTTPWNTLADAPKKKSDLTDWIKPMSNVGLLKKSKVKKLTNGNYIFSKTK